MPDYTMKLLSRRDYRTSSWSGGTTTELAIGPENSDYGDRSFQWRLSSATVELEESTFTSLPDYKRLIMTLKGGIRLSHNKGEWLTLPEFTVHAFDGGDETVSVGKVVDFNLMLRKGICDGELIPFRKDGAVSGSVSALLPKLASYQTVIIYCYEGGLTCSFETGASKALKAGESLRLDGSFKAAAWSYEAEAGASFVLAAVKQARTESSLKNKIKRPKE